MGRHTKPPTPCASPDCPRHAHAKGYCKLHYHRFTLHGDAEKLLQLPQTTCSICGEPARSKGLCNKHYRRSLGPRVRNLTNSSPCSICGAPAKTRGYCNAHYTRWKRYGDPLFTKRGKK
jgi:hypothetical protein